MLHIQCVVWDDCGRQPQNRIICDVFGRILEANMGNWFAHVGGLLANMQRETHAHLNESTVLS